MTRGTLGTGAGVGLSNWGRTKPVSPCKQVTPCAAAAAEQRLLMWREHLVIKDATVTEHTTGWTRRVPALDSPKETAASGGESRGRGCHMQKAHATQG